MLPTSRSGQQMAPAFLLRGLKERRLHFLLLQREPPKTLRIRRALFLAASYRLHCRLKQTPHSPIPQDYLTQAFRVALREVARECEPAMNALDTVWTCEGVAGNF